MTYRLRNLLIAIGLAIVAAVLVSVYVTQYKHHVQNGESTVQVYVAARDIPTGTSGSELIDGKYLRKESVERRNLVTGWISKTSQIADSYVTTPIYQDEQLSLRHFGQAGAQGARGQITGGQRAIEIEADPPQVLSGTLEAGDHVDVVANWTLPEGSSHHVSKIVLRDVLVLSAPGQTKTNSGVAGSSNNKVDVQLRVADTQLPKLFWVMQNGDWSLALRPPTKAGDGATTLKDSKTIAKEGVPGSVFNGVMGDAKQ
jgi:Flp pilus assembly protein CpaB